MANVPFDIYAMTLNKRRVYDELAQRKDRVYNFIARRVLDRIPVEDATTRVQLIIDRSKSKREIADFNSYITRQLQGRLDPRVPLDAWGTFRKHERNDTRWFDVFQSKVRYDGRYL